MLPSSTHPERNGSNSGSIACFKIPSIGNSARSIVPSAVIHRGSPALRFRFMVKSCYLHTNTSEPKISSAQVAAQTLEFVDRGRNRCLPYHPGAQPRFLKFVDFALQALRAIVSRRE